MPNSLPIQFDCLLDIGLHLVIICEQLVKDLNLCHHKLHEPIISELAMQPDGPKFLKFTHFIKLKLPFLKHNNIVIDVDCCTAIDKKNNFNLPLISTQEKGCEGYIMIQLQGPQSYPESPQYLTCRNERKIHNETEK